MNPKRDYSGNRGKHRFSMDEMCQRAERIMRWVLDREAAAGRSKGVSIPPPKRVLPIGSKVLLTVQFCEIVATGWQRWVEHWEVELMAVAGRWAMVRRRPGLAPFVAELKDLEPLKPL